MAPAERSTIYGQAIEYIENRLYLASYTHAPDPSIPFPWPNLGKRSPSKKSLKASQGPTPVSKSRPEPIYFTVDDVLFYNAFHADFGPFHIGHLYRFAVLFHDILGEPANTNRPVVFWSFADPRARANAACLVACYMVLIQNWPPHLALAPIALADPPYMPFRDAGYSQADYIISIQDVVYGVWKAREEQLCQLKDFNLEEYERYERVDMGDFNWISPQFLAFASPQSPATAPIPISSPEYAKLPSCIPEIAEANISQPFKNVLSHFVQQSVGLVVRLNSELYCPTFFTALGINHVDMIFEDGTCPPLPLVRKFIKLSHQMISRKKGIAVHCKAGLGRTGCLIGAYLIYKHGFTANEVIAYMRFMRPGMVVGPQQHWLHLNQHQFREWFVEDRLKAQLEAAQPTTPHKANSKTPRRLASNGQIATPPNGSHPGHRTSRSALGEIDGNDVSNTQPYQDENLPAPTPGQPRKYARLDSPQHLYARSASGNFTLATDGDCKTADTEIVTTKTHRHSGSGNESEEEYTLRMLARRRSQSRSPHGKARSVSYTATATTVTKSYNVGDNMYQDTMSDVENQNTVWDELAENEGEYTAGRQSQRSKTPATAKSGSGSGTIGMTKVRGNPKRSGGEEKTKVRKTSGRVGSASMQPVGVKR